MATQYTAGLTAGQVLTAATMNQIGAVTESWTPSFTPTAGTITTAALGRARYFRIQKLIIGRVTYNITTAGTAAGQYLDFSLPITASSTLNGLGDSIGFGRENGSTGLQMQVIYINTTTARVALYDAAGWIQSGRGMSILFIYEAA